MVAPTLKRKRDSLAPEPDPRNVVRKLFQPGVSPATSAPVPRASISGSEAKRPSTVVSVGQPTFRKPAVPKFSARSGSRSVSQGPLRNVTNTTRPVADVQRGKSFKPMQTSRFPSRSSTTNKTSIVQPKRADVTNHPDFLNQTRLRQAAEEEVILLREQVQQLMSEKASTDARHRAQLRLVEGQLEVEQKAAQERAEVIEQRDETISKLREAIRDRESRIAEGERLLEEGYKARKVLHNTIQELKGNIRVMARVRGNNGTEEASFKFPDHVDHRVIDVVGQTSTNYAGDEKNKTFSFTFDKVFTPATTQVEVFEEISQLVQSALDGYKVTVFAYGQTGSGKTFTMEGPENPTPETIGVIPRAVAQIFQEARELRPRGWDFKLEATFIEIYLEEIRDLLAKKNGAKHDIHHGTDGTTTISNVESILVSQPTDVYKLLQVAAKNRSTAATKMNERSSRSHSVFTLKITGINQDTNQKSNGVLNLIDLAGSERLNSSGVSGDRLKETQNINKSLSSLGDVIAALGSKKGHVPFRNSKLTYLLQNCLGGDGKTLMFVNVAPEIASVQESICSLRFASKVNACEIGTAKRKVGGQ
uniref:Kinesin-like protein n=1 Tax=Eutreptiella gymnastica TaxID=73025 RepID=A0A7S1NB39_9EUGL|mmetsp:Transcript_150193/g.262410  ORF Transcript_150193/g.262410 Transcript_150193/m.262410 type:complete len:590 (+) Transcript_150193:53-1822(+)